MTKPDERPWRILLLYGTTLSSTVNCAAIYFVNGCFHSDPGVNTLQKAKDAGGRIQAVHTGTNRGRRRCVWGADFEARRDRPM